MKLLQLIDYMEHQALLEDPVAAKKVVTQALKGYYLVDGIYTLRTQWYLGYDEW